MRNISIKLQRAIIVLCAAQAMMGAAYAQDKLSTDEEVLILRDDFGAQNIDPTSWHIATNAGARAFVDAGSEALTVVTEPNSAGTGIAVINGTKAFPIGQGKLIFKAREYVYRDHTLYGDFQPRGLVAGTDRRNAIEFVSALKYFPYGVACRTVSPRCQNSCRPVWI